MMMYQKHVDAFLAAWNDPYVQSHRHPPKCLGCYARRHWYWDTHSGLDQPISRHA